MFTLPRKDFPKHGFDPIQRHLGIEAWSKRALVENAVNGQWSCILDSAGEVSFACNCYDEVGAGLYDYSVRYGSPRGDRHFHAIFSRKLQEVLYGAFTTAFTILHPVRDLDLAVLILKTVRHEEQYGPRRLSITALGQDKLIVYRDKGMLDLFAAKAGQLADTDKDRQKEFDRDAAELS